LNSASFSHGVASGQSTADKKAYRLNFAGGTMQKVLVNHYLNQGILEGERRDAEYQEFRR
jgi:hypothetical protein